MSILNWWANLTGDEQIGVAIMTVIVGGVGIGALALLAETAVTIARLYAP